MTNSYRWFGLVAIDSLVVFGNKEILVMFGLQNCVFDAIVKRKSLIEEIFPQKNHPN
ncbi:MAG: hypothetical protein ABIP97_11245 [Chthoniobacterales bacterium]